MHILKDENGNLIPHGAHEGHDHDHHDHDHAHSHEAETCGQSCHSCEPGSAECKDETFALLNYMVNHNTSHAAEADKMADALAEKGYGDVAKQIKEGVSEYQKGNMYLSLALTLYKEHLKDENKEER